MMSTVTAAPPPALSLLLDRKPLLLALERALAVVPTRSCKPMLGGVHLSTGGGCLHIRGTDGELGLAAEVPTEGTLPPVVVPCQELIRRLRASRQAATLLTVRGRPQRLIVNGGRVEHALHTLPVEDFPPVPHQCEGERVIVAAAELHGGLAVASCAMARDPSRYATNGVLLECDDDGTRLVATDGRRLVTVELRQVDTQFRGQAILPARLVRLLEKFTAGEEVPIVIAVRPNVTDKGEPLPANLFAAGPRWVLSTQAPEGRFPHYCDVIPKTASRFAADRRLLADTLKEVMLSTGDSSRAVAVSLRPRTVELSASSAEVGSASAKLPARFLGGGDGVIHTAFNPEFLLEAVKTVPGDRIVIDVGQNGCAADHTVYGKPALLYAEDDARVRWVLMPLTMNYPATAEYLGSNFQPELADAG